MTDRITAPFTEQQVAALNAFQRSGVAPPFTCGNEQHRMHQTLIAEPGGLHCPDDTCDYQQPWAHAFMATPGLPEAMRRPGVAEHLAVMTAARRAYAPPDPVAAELAKVRQQLRDTEDQLAEARQRLEALRIHTAICRIEATIPGPTPPACGEILNGKTITDMPTTGSIL